MAELKYHVASDLFPMMSGEEYKALKEDIAEHGLLEPIWVYENQIVDGRNRYRACLELGIEPEVREWSGDGSLTEFVISMNLKRRHLTNSQKAMIAVDVEKLLAKEARERQSTHKKGDVYLSQKIEQGKSAEQAAQLVGTNRQYVSDAKKLVERAPDLAENVKNGEMSMTEARREFNKRGMQQEVPIITGKYRIFYADPPWQYGNAGQDEYGHAERHYPTMSIKELCEMGEQIQGVSENDSVLFLWVTSPMLEVAFEVIRAWGFKYKTSFVWDKIKHNFGHYNSVRHELLLVCTRGSCTPDLDKKFDSVVSIERNDEHSEKPEEFRAIIDTLYTHGERIELFSRNNGVKDWKVWGNQTPN